MHARLSLIHCYTILLALSGVALSASLGHSAELKVTLMDADFDDTTLDAGTSGTPVTQPLLQEGTDVGTWTVNSAGNAEFLRNTAAAGDTVFKPDQGSPDFTLTAQSPGALGLTTVSFDFALRRFNAGTQDRDPFITGFDSGGNELFTITVAATGGAIQRRLGFVSGGSTTYLGSVDDIERLTDDADADFSTLNTVTLELGASSFDIILDGTELASGIAYETLGVTTFESLQFTGDSPAGYYVDNILATTVVPEPSSTLLLAGSLGLLTVRRRRRSGVRR